MTQDTKNIIKGFAIASVLFGTIFFISTLKKNKEESDKGTDKDKGLKNKADEIAIDLVNPEPVAEDLTNKKDAFAHADGVVVEEVKIPEPTAPISDDAENALRWFVKNKYQIKPFENATDEIIIKQAKSLGWDGGEVS